VIYAETAKWATSLLVHQGSMARTSTKVIKAIRYTARRTGARNPISNAQPTRRPYAKKKTTKKSYIYSYMKIYIFCIYVQINLLYMCVRLCVCVFC